MTSRTVYVSPKLIRYGKFKALTAAGTGMNGEQTNPGDTKKMVG